MNYIKLVFTIDDDYQEQFIAELLDLDFYGFEQLPDKLIAYVEKPRYNDTHRERIEQLVAAFPGGSFSETEEIEEQNWNETWEQSIRPQRIGTFLVKPTWSDEVPSGEDEILLEIDPKMAFGTGYHATTRLMLNYMSSLSCHDKTVLDAGTGTGILAIAAIKLGAKRSVGFDIDPWSEQNALENKYINKVENAVDIRRGGIDVLSADERFDITLANINRNTIIELLPDLIKYTHPKGDILLSGLLEKDEQIIREKLSSSPVRIKTMAGEGEWILFHLKKND